MSNVTDEQIDHLWDTRVGDPTLRHPLTRYDVRIFARSVLALQPSSAEPVQPRITESEARILNEAIRRYAMQEQKTRARQLIEALTSTPAVTGALEQEGEPIAWEAPRGLGIKPFVSDRIYRLYSAKVQQFYKPFRCASCAEASATGAVTIKVVAEALQNLMTATDHTAYGSALARARAVLALATPTTAPTGKAEEDEAAFDQLCREHDIYGTAAARQCEVFWRAGKGFAGKVDAPRVRDEAFAAGWRTAANWMNRDDLIADIGSPAYIADRDRSLIGTTKGES